jgi:hypothetical protein
MDLRPILKVESALATRLGRTWHPIAQKAFATVQTAIATRDWGAAEAAANALDLEEVAAKNREFIKYYLLAAGLFGGRVARFGKDPAIASGSYESLLSRVADQFALGVENNIGTQLRGELLQLIANAQQVKKADAAPERFVKPFVSFKETGNKALQLLSALHTSRLAVWGFTAEADVRGTDTYRLTAVLDGRTSPFCDYIDGTEFEVPTAKDRINTILSAQNPDDLKVLAPWPDQSKAGMAEIRSYTTDELVDMGYDVPPFHPWCRTLCVCVDRVYDGEVDLPDDEAAAPQAQTKDAFTAVGAPVSDDDLEQWNQQIGLPPAQVLAAMAGISAAEVIQGSLGKQKFFSFGPDGELKMSIEGALAAPDSSEELKQVYDPFSGRLSGSWMEFNAEDRAAADWIGGSYDRMIDLAQKMGGSEFVIDTHGQYSTYAHALMGFVPATISDWEGLQQQIEQELEGQWPDDPEQVDQLKSILNNSDPRAIWALAALPMGQRLLSDHTLTMTLRFNDSDSMAMSREVLG